MKLIHRLKHILTDIIKNETDIPFSAIVLILLILGLTLLVKIIFGDLAGVTNNILAELIGLVISIIIVGLILANRWTSVQERLRKRLNSFIDTSIFRFRLGLDIFPEEENWGETDIIKEVELLKNTDIRKRLIQLSVSQLDYLLNLIEKIGLDLLRVQDKATIRPSPELWIILDTLEDKVGLIKNYLSEYYRHKESANGKQIVSDRIFPGLITKEIDKSISLLAEAKEIVKK